MGSAVRGALEWVQVRARPCARVRATGFTSLKTRWAIPPKANPAKRGRALGRVAAQYSQNLPENNDKPCLPRQKTWAFSGLWAAAGNYLGEPLTRPPADRTPNQHDTAKPDRQTDQNQRQ